MANKKWDDLDHAGRVRALKEAANEELMDRYQPPGDVAVKDFSRHLDRERSFWQVDKLGAMTTTGTPPNKETLIGAWRDLNKSEALLELIDNSIDAWLRRKSKYPRYTTPTLQVYIDLDSDSLTYEDNAGGVREDRLTNLVIPGQSDTSPFEHTIGSYMTGGKKAMFKLAHEVSIETRYRDPDEIVDKTLSVHLDRQWLDDPEKYDFPVFEIVSPDIEMGHTRYNFKLRDIDWELEEIDQIVAEIRTAYSLLIVKSPNIEIYFNDRENPLKPLDDLYRFSGATSSKVDIRPQRIVFSTKIEHRGESKDVTVEVVLGCRTTTGVSDSETWGIDLYGNNRLFIYHNQEELWRWYKLPAGNSSKLVRGYINIIGPNIFVPWDTHKRHLTTDHPIIDLLKSKPIKDFFASWKQAYAAISSAPDIKDTIKFSFGEWADRKTHDVRIQYDDKLNIPATKWHKTALPTTIHKPKVETAGGKKTKPMTITLSVSPAEFRGLRSFYGIDSKMNDAQAAKQLAEAIKASII